MVGSIMGFFELGAIILAWTILWNFLIKGFCAQHAGSPAADGLVAVYSA